jgi:predicted amidophosphoribosyltransferase
MAAGIVHSSFVRAAALILETEIHRGQVILVPVPNSSCTVSVANSRTAALAQAIADRSARVHSVEDIVRWDQRMPSAHAEDGPRDPTELYPHLRLRRIPTRRHDYVLIDDVLTSGGHLRALAAYLQSRGANVVLAVCALRADSIPQGDPFSRREDELEDFEP